MTPEKRPINITFEIVQLPEPNSHWYEVVAILSWKEYSQRMDTTLCLQGEADEIKEAICFLIGEHFDIREVKEQAGAHPGPSRLTLEAAELARK